jgi:hypothetical protein
MGMKILYVFWVLGGIHKGSRKLVEKSGDSSIDLRLPIA